MKHETLLNGLVLAGRNRSEITAPTLLRYDLGRDTVQKFLTDLRAGDWRDRLAARAAIETRGGLPVVDQHVHRKAVFVVVDAACLVPGFPRLDPARVTAAAMVIRREVTPKDRAPEGIEVWAGDEAGNPLGWIGAPEGASAPASRFEPDGALRRRRLAGANRVRALKLRLAGDAEGVSEKLHPMNAIPPDIAARIGRTLYFALLPTTSGPVVPGAPPPPPFSKADVAARVPNLLRAVRTADPLPPVNTLVDQDAALSPADPALRALRSTLTWLGQEAGCFTGESYAEPLRAALAQVALTGADQPTLLGWLDAAQAVVIERRPEAGTTIRAPGAWPAIAEAIAAQVVEAGYAAMAARWADLAPSVTRFGPAGSRYHVRCLLRIADPEKPDCPDRLLWSPLSRSYRIRPWFESGGAPPHQVELPSLANLKTLKPDVAVKVPPDLQQFMDRLNLKNLLDGKGEKGPSLSFGMICGFSIPAITICAYLVLQIFLQLFNILFFWMAWIKICIPFPTVTEDEG